MVVFGAANGEDTPHPVDQSEDHEDDDEEDDNESESVPVEINDPLVDVDTGDGDNELAVVEYLNDIYNNYRCSEVNYHTTSGSKYKISLTFFGEVKVAK